LPFFTCAKAGPATSNAPTTSAVITFRIRPNLHLSGGTLAQAPAVVIL
jgi:hypothetical protein